MSPSPVAADLPPVAADLPAVAGGWTQATVVVPGLTRPGSGGPRSFVLWTPADPEAVLDACEPGDDPYWATLWPVGETLAARLLTDPFKPGAGVGTGLRGGPRGVGGGVGRGCGDRDGS